MTSVIYVDILRCFLWTAPPCESQKARHAAVIRWSNTSMQCNTTADGAASFIVAGAPEPTPPQESNGTISKLMHAQSSMSPGRRGMRRHEIKGMVVAGTNKPAKYTEQKYSFAEFIFWCTAFDDKEITMPQYKKIYREGKVRVPPSMIEKYVYGQREKPMKLRSGGSAKKFKKSADKPAYKILPKAYKTMTSFPRKGPEANTVITRSEHEFMTAWMTLSHLQNKPMNKQDVMAWANRVAELKGKREAGADLRGWYVGPVGMACNTGVSCSTLHPTCITTSPSSPQRPAPGRGLVRAELPAWVGG